MLHWLLDVQSSGGWIALGLEPARDCNLPPRAVQAIAISSDPNDHRLCEPVHGVRADTDQLRTRRIEAYSLAYDLQDLPSSVVGQSRFVRQALHLSSSTEHLATPLMGRLGPAVSYPDLPVVFQEHASQH
ncbi:hypothetical protein [Amycolatopsis methanolica]|uniref:hypothetical protein n=1 Tax=Amycolatopsis methanolica TaxID=1814 RepID=UPI00341B10B0